MSVFTFSFTVNRKIWVKYKMSRADRNSWPAKMYTSMFKQLPHSFKSKKVYNLFFRVNLDLFVKLVSMRLTLVTAMLIVPMFMEMRLKLEMPYKQHWMMDR